MFDRNEAGFATAPASGGAPVRAAWLASILAIALLIPDVTTAQAAVYRWVDAKGQVHYTQTPPASGTYRLLDAPAPTVFTPDRKAMDTFLRATNKREAAEKKQRELVAEKQRADAARCTAARQRLEHLESRPPRRFFVTGANGEPSRMTEEQWEARKRESQVIITKSCR